MSEEDDGGSWNEVPNRRKPRSKGNPGERIGGGSISKFFVSNLPNGCNPWDVSEFVKVYGDVAGVYIARKKDKEGKKFGFISFRNVVDVKEMERALNGTKMGGFKLKVNLAKFASENSGLHGGGYENQKDNKKEQVKLQHDSSFQNQVVFNNGGRKLFRDLFNNPRGNQEGPKGQEETVGKFITIPDETLAFKDILGKALVGRCKDISTLRTLKSLMTEVSVQGVSLSYLGGLSVVIKFGNEDNATSSFLTIQYGKSGFHLLIYGPAKVFLLKG
ncbi:putative RNA recognition motif domain, nucleotide-binding alpha-beta plait domain superfamily [Helianthus debilis subsp. tardiflorus]